VVITPSVHQLLIKELNQAHPEISRMKSLAHGYMWWPGMDADLEGEVKQCHTCQSVRNSPPLAPVHLWQWPDHPWDRVHIDYAGPFVRKMFLLLVDAHSKWIDVCMSTSSSSQSTIEKLRQSYATFGIPKVLVSDNGSSFTSREFQEFITQNGIIHKRSSPYHPATNGLVERAVRTFKEVLWKPNYQDFSSIIA